MVLLFALKIIPDLEELSLELPRFFAALLATIVAPRQGNEKASRRDSYSLQILSTIFYNSP